MDSRRFDSLARSLAAPRSRRGLLGTLAAVLGATVAGGRADGAPNCRNEGHPCEGNQVCCEGLVCVVSGPGNAARCAALSPTTTTTPPPNVCAGLGCNEGFCALGCGCTSTAAGEPVCGNWETPCGVLDCGGDADCDPGETCLDVSGCCGILTRTCGLRCL